MADVPQNFIDWFLVREDKKVEESLMDSPVCLNLFA